MVDRLEADFKFYQSAVSLRQQRQEVLSANIANADTPNYKARDFDFGTALKQAVGQGSMQLPNTQMAVTSARHFQGTAHRASPVEGGLMYRQPLQPTLDGNTVDMDIERVQFADNTMKYQADLAIISQRLNGIKSALQQ